jgi:hypothetical protein
MQEKFRLYTHGHGRGVADNIKVVNDELTLVVHDIEERNLDGLIPHVTFVANPSPDETRLTKLHPNQPAIIEAKGRCYTVIVESIGTVQEDRLRAYADFTVTWDEYGSQR